MEITETENFVMEDESGVGAGHRVLVFECIRKL